MGVRGVMIDPCVTSSLIANLKNPNHSFQMKLDCKNHFTSNQTIIVVLTNHFELMPLGQVMLDFLQPGQLHSNSVPVEPLQ